MFGPIQKLMMSAVTAAAAERNVIYRKTPNPGGAYTR